MRFPGRRWPSPRLASGPDYAPRLIRRNGIRHTLIAIAAIPCAWSVLIAAMWFMKDAPCRRNRQDRRPLTFWERLPARSP